MDRAVVLMYHRVGASANAWERKYCVSPDAFESHMKKLAAKGMRAVPIDDFVAWIQGGPELPDGSFLLTFDDGFLGVYEHAYPVLRDLGWPATVFLVSGLIGGEDEWCRRENPSGATYPLLNRDHIEEMRGRGFSFHSHSRSHADLTRLDDLELEAELAGSRADLESLLGDPIPFLAYPYGRYDERVLAAARKAGYSAAFSVQPGFNRPGRVDPFRIRRLDVFGTDTPSALARKVSLGSNDGDLKHVLGYYWNRAANRVRSVVR